MTFARRVTVEVGKVDRYGRVVGKVLVAGSDINLRQIEAGMAWHYRAYAREQTADDRMTYAAAEIAAKASKKGLWGMPGAQAPWEFRRQHATAPHHRLAGRRAAVIE